MSKRPRTAARDVVSYLADCLPELLVTGGLPNALAIWSLCEHPPLRTWPFFVGWVVVSTGFYWSALSPPVPWRTLMAIQSIIAAVTWWVIG